MHFKYGEEELNYLKSKDKALSEVIEKIGYINREIDTDLFSSVVHHIVGQQISSKAQATIWKRIQDKLKAINADTIIELGASNLQALGISQRKADYIMDFALKVKNKEFDLEGIWQKSDDEAIKELTSLKGIGVWTAEMILLFSMERKDILSFDDLAIQRGLRMIYHHRKITKELFKKYKRRFSPYGSVASLYIWAVAGGSIEGMRDYAPKK